MLFAFRLLDYKARGRTEHQWQTDDGFCRYVSLLVELGYEPSDIERELRDERARDNQEPAGEDRRPRLSSSARGAGHRPKEL